LDVYVIRDEEEIIHVLDGDGGADGWISWLVMVYFLSVLHETWSGKSGDLTEPLDPYDEMTFRDVA
jgi:hypothetical protein